MNSVEAIDVSAWFGNYPFRHLPHHTVAHCRDAMRKSGVRHAVVSSFQCLFEEDNLVAFTRASHDMAGVPELELWPVVNPARPNQLSALEQVLAAHPARGLRLLPNYHGYTLSDPAVGKLMDWAAARDMIVQVFQAIADVRWQWMFQVPPVPDDDLPGFAELYPESKIIFSGLGRLRILAGAMRANTRCHVDLSGVRGPLFAIEHLVEELPANQILFGSLWPLQTTESILWQILKARIEPDLQTSLLFANAERLGLTPKNAL